jgi:hypothetical protein
MKKKSNLRSASGSTRAGGVMSFYVTQAPPLSGRRYEVAEEDGPVPLSISLSLPFAAPSSPHNQKSELRTRTESKTT